eukprot:NODE_3648_length_867_cov_38.979730_g3626_i0.p1 GENE.NODE_3648_length_867_cov_38.979730_g3626_i0~~NODE_3648_length_867_cov_38.979730_g3626_i0.p1  ORF type:complete len:283 (-),score=53.31 NODE_3648_length_867_cov_38.979730_g3626_i0:17-808(-)
MPEKFELVVVGGGAVGKSATTINYVQNQFEPDYDPTIEDRYSKQETVDGEVQYLEIIDTAGQEEYAVLREPYLKSGKGFLCVYSITDTTGFQEIPKLRDAICRIKDRSTFPVVLVGNKLDLEANRQVSREDGEALAANFFGDNKSIPFFEISARERINIDECFLELIRRVREDMNPTEQPAAEASPAQPAAEKPAEKPAPSSSSSSPPPAAPAADNDNAAPAASSSSSATSEPAQQSAAPPAGAPAAKPKPAPKKKKGICTIL